MFAVAIELLKGGFTNELFFNFHSFSQNLEDPIQRQFLLKFGVQKAGKVAVQTFVSADQLV